MGTWNQCNGVVMEVKLEKSEIGDLLQVASIELAGNLRCSRGARMTPRCGGAGLRWGKTRTSLWCGIVEVLISPPSGDVNVKSTVGVQRSRVKM